ncbi:MAG: helix-turn-helix transcriptional regulator [Clostridia bacterium]|nr:helix-turn-helix transcriptional regulator [Clostridia bacterium]
MGKKYTRDEAIVIGQVLKNHRLDLYLTQKDVAKKTGYSLGVIRALENGRYACTTDIVLRKVCKAYDLDFYMLESLAEYDALMAKFTIAMRDLLSCENSVMLFADLVVQAYHKGRVDAVIEQVSDVLGSKASFQLSDVSRDLYECERSDAIRYMLECLSTGSDESIEGSADDSFIKDSVVPEAGSFDEFELGDADFDDSFIDEELDPE